MTVITKRKIPFSSFERKKNTYVIPIRSEMDNSCYIRIKKKQKQNEIKYN